MNWIDNAIGTLEKKIELATRTDIESLCFFRIVFGLFTILFFWPSYRWIGDVPDAFFNPPIFSVAALFSGFPSPVLFLAIDIGIFVTIITLTIGLFTRISTIALLLLILLGNSFQYSFGKIDHGILLYLCVLLVMSFKDWGRFLSVDSLIRRNGTARFEQARQNAPKTPARLTVLGILVAFGFFTAGYGKALNWVDFDLSTSGVLFWLYGGYFTLGRGELLAPLAIQLEAPLFWEIADLSAVLFEMGFLFMIFWRRSWFVWLTIACCFHLINCLLFNIPFIVQAIAYLAFIPWSGFAIVNRVCFRYPKTLLLGLFGFCSLAAAIKLSFSNASGGILFAITNQLFGSSAELQVTSLFWLSLVGLFAIAFRHLFVDEQARPQLPITARLQD
ncbi:hypothetical protein IQ241_05395 [Romeria aff. gracilis LEGE 07310]|uniref:HTTM domain-containing protein n=1 Tax=Vasconcelosia minhoensis LEGE 07310 TaxID=915328 RepID=A0A8J7A9W4_9CYAN|nr:hypothetical protein [Romeria gracilis]MBE9076736.1 hypothetical protein [Romeria aff. gracilis LEGE 07310]